MNCDNIRQLLHAYLDDELDLSTALQIEQHLPGCADCQKRLDAARTVSRAAGQPALYHAAPEAFREKLKLAIRAEENSPDVPTRATAQISWWRRPSVVSGLAAVLVLMIGSVVLFRPVHPQSVQIAELIDSHLRSLEANHLFDVESTDQHTVKPWFAGKLDFSPPVIDLSAEGFRLVGGRVDYLNEKKVATLVYRRNKHIINLFIWPGAESMETESRQGFNIVRFECKGMSCWAISDVSATDLQRFADLFTVQNPASTRS